MIYYSNELYHHGVTGQKWGERRYQNEDGTLTEEGRQHYGYGKLKSNYKKAKATYKSNRTKENKEAYKQAKKEYKQYKSDYNKTKQELSDKYDSKHANYTYAKNAYDRAEDMRDTYVDLKKKFNDNYDEYEDEKYGYGKVYKSNLDDAEKFYNKEQAKKDKYITKKLTEKYGANSVSMINADREATQNAIDIVSAIGLSAIGISLIIAGTKNSNK